MEVTETKPNGFHELDVVSLSVNGFRGAASIMTKDLEALPDESFLKVFNPKTRTIADIIYEVILVNDHVGMVMREEEPFVWPEGGWITAPAEFDGKESVLAAFRASCEKFSETIASFSAEKLCEPLSIESGATTRFERIRFVMLHMWYHSGQLNFVQTLLGDDAWHW